MKSKKFMMRASVCALFSGCILAAQGADTPAQIKVSDAQLQSLGIQLLPLDAGQGSVKGSYPAQVVVPAGAEQIVSAPVTGMVAQVLVQPYEGVRAGTPLLRLVSPELGQLQLQLMQAASRAELARQAAQREQRLFDEGIIPQRRQLEAQAALKEADAALAQARSALRLAGMGTAQIDRVAQTGVVQDSITLTATKAGVLTAIEAKPGQRVEAASALMHVTQTYALALEIQLPAAAGKALAPGAKVTVQGRAVTARIANTSPTVSPGTQSSVVRANVEGKADGLRPGELVAVELPATAGEQGFDVPIASVARDGQRAFVFVRTPAGFDARQVNVSASAGQRVRIQGSLKAGEQIAINGIVALKGAWLGEK
jgi:cobalt-zinc-cadmium efflux system membrane fusion protein